MAKKRPPTITDLAYVYRTRAYKRFHREHGCNDDHCEFCAGWTWGAVDGYKAGMKLAKKLQPKRASQRRRGVE